MTGVGQPLAGHAGSASAALADGDADALASSIPRVARVWADTGPDEDLHRRIDGSVVFVDISGFTKMSERLARFGNVGAEHVTEVIGSRFSRLLADAYDYGATLLKFGGDALLLFFSGDAHAARGRRRGVRDAQHAAPDRGRRHRGRHGDAAHDRRRPQRAVRLLPRRRFAPGAHRRGPDRERDGCDRRRGAHGSDRHRSRDRERALAGERRRADRPGLRAARRDRRASARRGRARRRRPRPEPARARRAPRACWVGPKVGRNTGG